MKRNKEGWILVLWLSLTALHVEHLSARSSWTWFDAKKLCEKNNDILAKYDSTRVQRHWTSRYRRYSFWIKILGCYEDSKDDVIEDFNMTNPSAGFCQELCAAVNSSIFGVKQEKCRCFRKLALEEPVSQNNCHTVSQIGSEIKFQDLGGSHAYTIYESDFNVTKRGAIYCVAIQCHNDNRFFFEPWSNCSLSHRAVCQNSVSKSYQNWVSSMGICRDNSSYLAGNVSFNDVDETCGRLNVTLEGPAWLGVAKEVYIGSDSGVNITKEEEESFLGCEICDEDGCSFKYCYESVSAVYCEKGFSVVQPVTAASKPGTTQFFTSTSDTPSYTSETSISFTVSISTQSSVIPTNKQYSSDSLSIILPLVVTAIVIGCFAAAAAIFYMRRKKELGSKTETQMGSTGTDNGYTDIDIDGKNKNYFVLEQQSKTTYNESHVNYTYDSNPYTDTTEGVYDHLRDKESRKRREDDENLRDSNPYKDIAEGIYDHLKDKESGKINTSDGKVTDSNPYKETEGGMYDHLRAKETGKFAEENNYDHTPDTTGKEYCVHVGMDEHTSDTDYDHAMSFYNYKQHHQVIEETDGGYAKTDNVS